MIIGSGDVEARRRFLARAAEVRERLPEGFEAQVVVCCPFCEEMSVVVAVLSADGESVGVAHFGSPCEEFESLEPDEFLERARLRLSD